MIPREDFRRLLGHFATGVTVVTVALPGQPPTGITVSAFASVSLDPPLVLVCIGRGAQSHPLIRQRKGFAVNVLQGDQAALSRRFASTGEDKFAGVAHHPGPLGNPLLEGALAWMECATVSEHEAGDHTIVVARVEEAGTAAGEPLLYYRGQYRRLGGGPA